MGLGLVLIALGLLLATSAVVALPLGSERAALHQAGAGGSAACLLGAIGSGMALLTGDFATTTLDWPLPIGAIAVGLDPLSAFFALCVFVVGLLASIFGAGYAAAYLGRQRARSLLALFPLLIAAMGGVVVAQDSVLFLAAWEVMTAASFFLVIFESQQAPVRRAGSIYLIASQLGVVPLIYACVLAVRHAGDFSFAAIAATPMPESVRNALFVLALLGFGAKAGFWPLHVWLPEAHPAAPSHVSALMSGGMIKLGIYGLLRVVLLLGAPPAWWGMTLAVVGGLSGVLGVLLALTEHDLKRLLAYHSVENVGIIALGLGIGLLGQSQAQPAMAFLGYGGALLHVLNHGLFKGLLFQGAGSIYQATHTRDVDALGGLLRRMPWTGLTFLIGSAAISGLPPLNGFVSELLILAGAFYGIATLPLSGAVCSVGVAISFAMICGLAATCFVKAFGVVFLGTARSEAAASAREVGLAMRSAMVCGAAACIAIGVWPNAALAILDPVVGQLAVDSSAPALVVEVLTGLTRVGLLLLPAIALLAAGRALLLRRREVRHGATWGCGYDAPTPRMQYSAASFAQPVLIPYQFVLDRQVDQRGPDGLFPTAATYHEHLADPVTRRLYEPAVAWLLRLLDHAQAIQRGEVQRFLIYVLGTLVLLLLWQLGLS